MASPSPEQLRRLRRIILAQTGAREKLTKRLLRVISRLWKDVEPFDQRSVGVFVRGASEAIQEARIAQAGVTQEFLEQIFDEMEIPHPRLRPVLDINPRRGVTLEQEMQRPAADYRRFVTSNIDELIAQERAEERARVMAEMDEALAMRDTAQQLMQQSAITGYRRIIHPERSLGGTCGLCIAAATRVYKKEKLLPLHDRCKCTVLPITATLDPGNSINLTDIADIYDRAGGNTAARLKKIRYVIQEHGELGPVLRDARHHFRGPDEVAAA